MTTLNHQSGQLKNNSKITMTPYLGLHQFMVNGICIIPISDESSLENGFNSQLLDQPELLQPNGELIEPPYVGGGFSAFGHASSFHTPFVRGIRQTIRDIIIDAIHSGDFKLPDNLVDGNIEIVPDRQSFRPAGVVPTKESWHRDVSPNQFSKTNPYIKSQVGDLIFGGWINCNTDHSQHFVCIPGSHHLSHGVDGATGFKPLTKNESLICKATQVVVEIPPGHAILFIQDTIHCINATRLNFDMRRVYLSYRISSKNNTSPLIVDIVHRLQQGSIVPLKSGQLPNMYPKLWKVCWQDKLISFSSKFHDPSLKSSTYITGKRLRDHDDTPDEGRYDILLSTAPTLYPIVPYSDTEIMMYCPCRI